MTALLHSIDDSRSPLAKLSRKELEHLARLEKREDIKPGMPADLMRKRFMTSPPRRMPRPMRAQLGSQSRLIVPVFEEWVKIAFMQMREMQPETVEVVDALADLEKQWEMQSMPAEAKIDWSTKPFHEIKSAVKKMGITAKRTWKKHQLVAILNGQDPSELDQ